MANLLSPGVAVSETDLTTTVSSVGNSSGALVGKSSWGPLNVVTLIGSEDELIKKFGKPTDESATTFFTASNFLSYTDSLYFARVDNTTSNIEYSTAKGNAIGFKVVSNACSKTTIQVDSLVVAESATTLTDTAGNYFSQFEIGDYLKLSSNTFKVTGKSVDSSTGNITLTFGSALTAGTYTSLDFFRADATKCIISNVSLKLKNARVSDVIELQYTNSGETKVVKYNIANIVDGDYYTVTSDQISTVSSTGSKILVYQTIIDAIATEYSTEKTTGKLFVYTGVLNATAEENTGSGKTGTGICIKNETDYLENFANGIADNGMWAARYPGEYGNSIKVSICPSKDAYESVLGTGFTSVGNTVTYSGNKNLADYIIPGSIIKNADIGEERTVLAISGNTVTIQSAFTTELTSTNNIKCRWQYADLFGVAPTTSDFVSDENGVHDELHVVVIDQDGEISGTKGTILEKYAFVSKAKDAKGENGVSKYYVNQINNNSQYIYWCDHPSFATNWGVNGKNITFSEGSVKHGYTVQLAGGKNYTGDITAERIDGYSLFLDPDGYDISLVMTGEGNAALDLYVINSLCETRKNCIALISPEMSDVVDNPGKEVEDTIAFRNTLPTTSYAVMDSGWKYQFDKYNDVYRWIPLNGDIAGLCARTDYTNESWYSPAGFTRGNIKNVVKLAYSPYKAERDNLYSAGINPVVNVTGEGVILYGDKTMQSKPSAFDRINVRRLFITLEKAISKSAKYFLFEFNDDFTRQQFVNMVTPYLQKVQAGKGIYDFKVVCDSTNNTASVIDNNEFVGDIYIKPSRSINFIQLNFVAVATGVEFSEVVGKF